MPYCVNPWRWGAAHVNWYQGAYSNCTPSYGSAIYLGLTENGPDISVDPRFAPVQGDDFGGQEGEPADEQFMGVAAVIDLVLNRFPANAHAALLQILSMTTTPGTFPEPGAFVKADGLFGKLEFVCSQASLYFPITRPIRQAFNVGARHEKQRLAWRAMQDTACSRKLYVIGAGRDLCVTS